MEDVLEIREGDFETPALMELLTYHYETSRTIMPGGNPHVFPISRLQADDIRFWSFWSVDELQGFGALKTLDAHAGEIKSMHVAQNCRGQGIGERIIFHIEKTAQRTGLSRLFLETGSGEYFAPARRLYWRCGFQGCGPFADYTHDPRSVYMMKDLSP